MVTSGRTTTYSYDSSNTELMQKTDPNGKMTTYSYDSAGSLSRATYDPAGAN